MYKYSSICAVVLLVSSLSAKRSHDWKDAEDRAENAVAQIVVQHSQFNWREPFKAPKQKEGAGSGFFFNNQGYLLTNYHVVEDARSLQVYLPFLGQKPAEADIVGVCPERDLAVIKLRDDGIKSVKSILHGMPFLHLGDSDLLFPTEPVLALGYPLGQRYLKSTVGVVAGREYIAGCSYMHVTAPINPGNSGGPLLNLEGEVVGINTAAMTNAQNIGYIVPIYDAKILLKDLLTKKLVRKPNLGLYCNPTTDEHAQLLKNPLPAGAYIRRVEKGSVAEKAGILAGDMLYAINGHKVDSYADVTVNWKSSVKVSLEEYLIRLESKTKLSLEIYRNGKKQIMHGMYDEQKLHPLRRIYPDYEPNEIDYEIIGGMCVMQLRANHLEVFDRIAPLQRYRMVDKQDTEALIITRILPGSVIHRVSCFYEGSLLTEVNGKKVKNIAQLRTALKESATSGIISFKSEEHSATVVSLDSVLKDEARLSRDFKYETTQGIAQLKKQRAPSK